MRAPNQHALCILVQTSWTPLSGYCGVTYSLLNISCPLRWSQVRDETLENGRKHGRSRTEERRVLGKVASKPSARCSPAIWNVSLIKLPLLYRGIRHFLTASRFVLGSFGKFLVFDEQSDCLYRQVNNGVCAMHGRPAVPKTLFSHLRQQELPKRLGLCEFSCNNLTKESH